MTTEIASTLKACRLGGRLSADPGLAGQPRDGAGRQTANRLSRELESIEVSLAAAERAALASCPARRGPNTEAGSDVSSRRAELELRERELQEWERQLERQRMLLEQTGEKLQRGRDSLKRAIHKFRAQAAQRGQELETRQQCLAAMHSEIQQARRENAREQMRLKALARESFHDCSPAALAHSVALG